MTPYPALHAYIQERIAEIGHLSPARRERLGALIDFLRACRGQGKTAALNFICTHNSRRSHLAQIWAATAAAHYQQSDLETYSGGTETTAFNPRAVEALRRAGFRVEDPGGDNPRYRVSYGPEAPTMVCFSKTFDDPANPTSDFAAVMTCTDADQNCPVIPGAKRISLPYEDPKAADGTPEEAARYDERCRQIATEMLYVMSQI
jgi:arsenate reductase